MKRAWTDLNPKVALGGLVLIVVPLIVWAVKALGLDLDISPLGVLFGAVCVWLASYWRTDAPPEGYAYRRVDEPPSN